MKNAALVIGLESSGTKMLTECFVRMGYFGSSEHSQPLDSYGFSPFPAEKEFVDRPDNIVLRRSLPHGRNMIDIPFLLGQLYNFGYKVEVFLIIRDLEMTIQSQIKNGHKESRKESSGSITNCLSLLFQQLNDYDGFIIKVVRYEKFISDEEYRKRILGGYVEMEFFDGNLKYEKEYL